MIRALIVDDIALARENIRLRLQKHKDITVVGEAASGTEALTAVSKLVPDLIFLDIQMPGSDGFTVLNNIPHSPPPVVIFITAHDEYAVKAFAVNAEHYLLKPVDDEQFGEALDRARQSLSIRRVAQGASCSQLKDQNIYRVAPSDQAYLDRIAVRDGDSYRMLKTSTIDWVEAAGNYIRIRTGGESYTVRTMLREIEQQLNPGQFARISKSVVVNLDSVVEIKKLWHGDFEVVLVDGARVRLSRRYRDRLLPVFS